MLHFTWFDFNFSMALSFQFTQHCFFAQHSCFIPASVSKIYNLVSGVSISCSFLLTYLIVFLFLSTWSFTSLYFYLHRFLLQSANVNRQTLLMKSIVLSDQSVIFNQYLSYILSNRSLSHFQNYSTFYHISNPTLPRLVNFISESTFLTNRLSPHYIIFYFSNPNNLAFSLTFYIISISWGSITSGYNVQSTFFFFLIVWVLDLLDKFTYDLFLRLGSLSTDSLPVQVLICETFMVLLGIVSMDLEQICFIFASFIINKQYQAALQLFRPENCVQS